MGKGLGTVPWGTGNQVSAEFNLVYRWHSAISKKDEKWTEELYIDLFGKPSAEVSMRELMVGLKKWEQSLDKDPMKRPFAKLERQQDGRYSEDELVGIMTDAIEGTAGNALSFPSRNVVIWIFVLTVIQVLSEQTTSRKSFALSKSLG
jgi:linoleate 10R-lipoxygenase